MHRRLVITCLLSIILAGPAAAQIRTLPAQDPAGETEDRQVINYPVSFFDRYRPNTALDMVRQLPGFIINDGDNERGFGGAVGNILIDDRRPSAKQDPPSQILSRIPAGQVREIELIRGQVRSIDLQGHAVVANVRLREDATVSTRWETSMRYNYDVHPPTWDGNISISNRWRDIEYNAGIAGRTGSSGDGGSDLLYDGDGNLTEASLDAFKALASSGTANLNASTWLAGDIYTQLNAEVFVEERDTHLNSYIMPVSSGVENELIDGDISTRRFELGTDAEKLIDPDLLGKLIFLFSHQAVDNIAVERNLDPAGELTLLRVADTGTGTSEAIGRLELDWAAWEDHTVQSNLELAYNILDNSLVQTVDTGTGAAPVDVPGANTRVEEIRADFSLQDTWTLGAFELDYGLGLEVSRLSQTGDAEQERDFRFLKPQALLSWSPTRLQQTRLRLAREVAQLNFNDFVSATVFEDDDLALGNPDLRPETTWIAELSHERRFGQLSVFTLTAFHHWISDVQDLLPITAEFEAPGNIGDGSRWGLEFESTVPLDALRLSGARLDLQLRWQDSSVTDPVTGSTRVLSAAGGFPKPLPFRGDEIEHVAVAIFRQDFEAARVAWGFDVRERAERPRYKVNELEVFDEGTEVNAFVETTRWWGLKVRLEGQDVLDFNQSRDRTIYQGLRGLSPVRRFEIRDRTDGARAFISVSGSF